MAEFVTPPIYRGAEVRRYMRDPDGYLIEVGLATGLQRRHKQSAPFANSVVRGVVPRDRPAPLEDGLR